MKLLNLISRGMAPLTLICAVIAFYQPAIFLIFKDYFLWFFAASMFALGVVLKPDELKTTIKTPKPILIGILSQYSIMPLLGATAAWLAGLPAEIALGVIIVGCAPGAMASNVIVFLAGGAVAFSVTLTTIATFLSPALTPLLVEWLGGTYLPIPFWPMMRTILLTVLLPLTFGMLIRKTLGQHARPLIEFAPSMASLAIIIICAYAVAANHDRLNSITPELFLVIISVNALGYLLGWSIAKFSHFSAPYRLTLAIEIGMQNAGLGVALALKHFSPETALPGALFAVWCILTGAGASAWLRHKQRLNALTNEAERT
ncbi:MAG: BASS family bile acid:Na+ symporter [Cycloclasticus pugetii]|jgi:BASS family bile acid:Na+ symporter|uniref:Bile acid:sodium symporter n=1 Tax=Cycloclasticus pugetii TaxID=34068 RepID=A0AB33Z0H5_9GAMM|nr:MULTISPECIES: bile acid:sodium symporter family protein [Cycloclasticus]ATI02402.1 bile acid:sodium symporter family protein [Cycloclasticus sp. PY97N]EPD12491.1 bile acid:sodium symporter [Cycloclasticus pugetii]MBV1899469.1 bile acid:sodium symporter family protein [Cycloclasticus sp.]MDF1830518.1 bile acid:sodium symporter family protein [Cycloclasticus pugetii]